MAAGALRTGAIVAGIVALAPLTWWAAHAVPAEVPADRIEYADYLWHPPDVSGSQRLGVGLSSLGVVAVGVFAVASSLRSSDRPRRWVRILLPLAGVAGYAGLTYRFATAPVSGANIGGALLIMAGFLVVPGLLGISLFSVFRGQ